ncbi:MAG: ABC transporter permease [Anaerolineales bacterium]|nr:ABC transporter permease [Anaerolineales bacterium]
MVPISDRRSSQFLISIARRLLESILTAWAAVTFTFLALRLSAGDPVGVLLSRGLASPADADALRIQLGFNRPLVAQYVDFLSGLPSGDLGQSLYTSRPVADIILEQLPYTLALAGLALVITFVLSGFIGIGAAWWQRKPVGGMLQSVSGTAIALPVIFVGTLVLWALRAVASSGFLHLRPAGFQLFLPALVLGFSNSGGIAWTLQAGIQENMQAQFFLAARARGVRSGFPLLWHALKPALPPAVSLFALEASFLFAGTVVIETIFARPGLGRLLVQSILDGDFPVAQGLVVIAALVYTFSLGLADICSYFLDPRIGREA